MTPKTDTEDKGRNSPSGDEEGRSPSPADLVTPGCAGDEGTSGGLHAGRRDGAQEDGRQREGGGPRLQQREETRAAMPAPNYGGGDSKLGGLHAS